MMRIIRADERYCKDRGWLKTCWLFSFDEYYDPENVRFGALRVFNDDVVQPHNGFPMHPHSEAEIITIPLSGELTHEDSTGSRGTIRAGDVQRMSAGTGVTHSEMNTGDTPVHFYQIWMQPGTLDLPSSYDQRSYDSSFWENRLAPVASGQGIPDVVTFNTDATIYRADLDKGISIDYAIQDGRCIFIYLTGGELQVNNERLNTHDQARISDEKGLRLQALEDTGLILIDVPCLTK